MAYDAGSVESTLDLDRSPFQESLAAARRMADEFERETFTASVDVDSAGARTELARVDAEADRLDRKRVGINVDVDESNKGSEGLKKVALALAPLSALAIGATGAIGGLSAAAAPAALGLVGFAALAKPALEGVMKAAQGNKKAIQDLDPALRPAVASLKASKQEFEGLQHAMAPDIVKVFTGALGLGLQTLKLLMPAVHGTAGALKGLEGDASRALDGPFWKRFFDFVGRQAGPALTTFGHVLGNLAHGFAGLLMAFEPIVRPFEQGLERISASFARWGQNVGQTQGFKTFLDYLRANGPLLLSTLKDVGTAVVHLAGAFATAGPSTLSMIGSFARLITAITTGHPQLTSFIMNMLLWGTTIKNIIGPMVGLVSGLGRLGGAMTTMATVGSAAFRAVGAAASFLMANPIILAIAGVIAIGVLLATHWEETKKALAAAWGAIKDAAEFVFKAIKTAVIAYLEAPIKFAKEAWKLAGQALSTIWHGIARGADAIWNTVKDAVAAPVRGAVRLVTEAWNIASGAIADIWNGIKRIAERSWNAITGTIANLFKGALSTIGGFATRFYNAGVAIIQKIIDGVVAAAKALWNTVNDIISKVGDLLPFSEPKDPRSPLRGLSKSGEAIIGNITAGVWAARGGLIAAVKSVAADASGALAVTGPGVSIAGAGGRLGAGGMAGPQTEVNARIYIQSPAGTSPDGTMAAAQVAQAVRSLGGLP